MVIGRRLVDLDSRRVLGMQCDMSELELWDELVSAFVNWNVQRKCLANIFRGLSLQLEGGGITSVTVLFCSCPKSNSSMPAKCITVDTF